MTHNRLVRKTEATTILGVGKSTLWKLSKRNDFPEEIVISPAIRGWMLKGPLRLARTTEVGRDQKHGENR